MLIWRATGLKLYTKMHILLNSKMCSFHMCSLLLGNSQCPYLFQIASLFTDPSLNLCNFFQDMMKLNLLSTKNIFGVCRIFKLKEYSIWLLQLLWISLQWFLALTIVTLVSIHFGSDVGNSNTKLYPQLCNGSQLGTYKQTYRHSMSCPLCIPLCFQM
jgi:hypothetical protein